jgi:hypothetical protein
MTDSTLQPASLRSGALQFGLDLHWRYLFVGQGSTWATTPDTVFLDVGNRSEPGVLDTHSVEGLADSTAQLVVARPELVYNHLVGPWLARAQDGQDLRGRIWTPAIVCHRSPDFDAMVSALLVRILVETGDLPPWADDLAAYAACIDQGRWRLEGEDAGLDPVPVHFAILAIQNLPHPDGDAGRLVRGMRIIQAEVEAICHARGRAFDLGGVSAFSRGRPGAGSWRQVEGNDDIRKSLLDDCATFEEDRRSAVTEEWILPTTDGEACTVPGLVLPSPSRSFLAKYRVRAEGRPFFACELEGSAPGQRRVIFSLDPTWTEQGSRPTLKGLGSALERLECAERRKGNGEDARNRTPRFCDGSCDNGDPWYDGRGHGYTIVDSPRCGSVLDVEAILAVARSRFWEPWVDAVRLVTVDASGSPAAPRVAEKVCVRAFLESEAASLPPPDGGDSRIRALLVLNYRYQSWPSSALEKLLCEHLGPRTYGPTRGLAVYGGRVTVQELQEAGAYSVPNDDFKRSSALDVEIAAFKRQADDLVLRRTKRAGLLDFVMPSTPSCEPLRAEILSFDVRLSNAHLHETASASALAEALHFSPRMAEVRGRLDSLAEIEHQAADRMEQWLLFLIGLFGVAHAVLAWIELPELERWSFGTGAWIVAFNLPLLLFFVVLMWRRPKRW